VQGLVGERRLTADVLDATAVAFLGAGGNVVAAALSTTLIAGGEHIRELTARRSRRVFTGLLASTGQLAWVVRGARKERLPAEAVQAGDTVVVYPGELVLVDGVVIRGRALVDQKVLTGESRPVLKRPGDPVYAATVLADGKLYVRTEKVGLATRASQIIQILEGAPTHDTRLGNYARRFADRLVLPTLVFAGGVFAVTRDATRAISVIVFDFATGVRVSAPTTVLAAMTAAAQRDVLIKSGRALEQLAALDTLVLDKTGTITAGTPAVTGVRPLGRDVALTVASAGERVRLSGADALLALAAAVERRLTHPAAHAVVRAAERRDLPIPERGDSHYTVGQGVTADVEGSQVLVGSGRFLTRSGVALPPAGAELAARAAARGGSTLFVARDGVAIGAITYADLPRPEARAIIRALHDRGLRHCVMVTGDDAGVASAIAQEVGLDRVEAEVFPERKAEIVRQLQRRGHVVGVIGDGINDSPALAYADVSISLKAGSDVARETADVVLHGDLWGLVQAIDVARESMAVVRSGLAIVGVPNAAGMVLAGAGLVPPAAATAVNNGSNVAAALNALRPLLHRRAPAA
jgi:Cu2+-exporting ATPase